MIEFDVYYKISGITGIFTLIGIVFTFTKHFAELQTKRVAIEKKRLPDAQFPSKKRNFPICIEKDLVIATSTRWLARLIFTLIFIIISTLTYSIGRNISTPFGDWYRIFVAILTYLTAFGPLVYVVFITSRFVKLYLRLTHYENADDLYRYNCKR